MNNKSLKDNKALSDQIKTSITAGVLQVVGGQHIIKITDISVTVDGLQPVGDRLTVKLSIDIYPDDRQPSANTAS